MTDTVSKLVRACNFEREKRTDFPTIWMTILKPHPYVVGLPIQDKNESGPVLKIPLLTGRFILFDGSAFFLA